VDEIWENFKEIMYKGMNVLFHMNHLEKNQDPGNYNMELKRLKSKIRKT
jgi:hypothetical protein